MIRFATLALVACACGGTGTETRPLCQAGGDPSVHFAARVIGGGALEPGRVVLSENGWSLLVITGDCRYWARDGDWAELRTGALSPDRATEVADQLGLQTFADLAGTYRQDLCDGADWQARFGDDSITIETTCRGGGTQPPESIADLRDRARGVLLALLAEGQPADHSMRFILFDDEAMWTDAAAAAAVAWPLAADPRELAMTYDDPYDQRGQGLLASGDDAAALRQLRAQVDVAGSALLSFIPVTAPVDGARLNLYARDAMPFEDESGLVDPALFGQ